MAGLLCHRILRRSLHIVSPLLKQSAAPEPTTQTPLSLVSRTSSTPVAKRNESDFFGLKDLYTLEDLFEARVHLGHKDTMLNEYMRPFIYGKRLGVHVFDLEQTEKRLERALNVTAEIAYRKGIILFVHQSRQNGHIVEAAAKECGEYAFCRRWIGGTLTDSQRVFGSVIRPPDLIIIFSCVEKVNEVHRAIIVASKMLIPTIGICDSNADPTLVTYPVPGNDDTPQSIELYSKLFKMAIIKAKAKQKEVIESHGEDYYNETCDFRDR